MRKRFNLAIIVMAVGKAIEADLIISRTRKDVAALVIYPDSKRAKETNLPFDSSDLYRFVEPMDEPKIRRDPFYGQDRREYYKARNTGRKNFAYKDI